MTGFKSLVVAAVAAGAITVGGLVAAPGASAASKLSCTQAYAFSVAYYAAAEVNDAVGNGLQAAYYRGKADESSSAPRAPETRPRGEKQGPGLPGPLLFPAIGPRNPAPKVKH